ncbi:SAP domain-containing protein [Tsukamurella soli]
MAPDRFGLYPHEVLLLTYAPLLLTRGRRFQLFWADRYGVADPLSALRSLAERGFLAPENDADTVGRQTIAGLKPVLAARGLKVSGSKAALVDRVLDSLTPMEIDDLYPERYYASTAIAIDAVAASPQIPHIHRHPNIEGLDIFSLTELVRLNPGPYRDTVWRCLNWLSLIHAVNGKWGFYGSARYAMATFLAEEDRWRDAIAMLAEVAFYDLNCTENTVDGRPVELDLDYVFPYETSIATVAPGIAPQFMAWGDDAGLSEKEVRDLMLTRMAQQRPPVQVFTVEECVDIVFLTASMDTAALDAIYTQAGQRLRGQDRG